MDRRADEPSSQSYAGPCNTRRPFRVSLDLVRQQHRGHANAATISEISGSSPARVQMSPKQYGAPLMRKTTTPTVVTLTSASTLSDHDIQSADPGWAPSHYIDDPPWDCNALVRSAPSVTLPLPIPTTPASLYQNLLYLLSYHAISPAPLPVLLSYHASFSRDSSLRSTRSYNLLIRLAIRHAAFKLAERLLGVMRAEGIQGDLETWKLCTRWLIRTGRWGDAWKEVTRMTGRGEPRTVFAHTGQARADIPLPIWLEFFGTMKRGALRRRTRTRKWSRNEHGSFFREAGFEVLRENGDRVVADSSRYGMLMSHPPALTQGELRRMPPRAMHLTVHLMLRTAQRDLAMKATTSYLRGLPPKIDETWARACLDLIHLHIIFPPTKRGLSAHHKARKTVNSLLSLHPRLRPNSTTLLLLLRGLRSTTRCGTIAQNFVSSFKRRWGPKTEDQRVRRRVASLALKEGRVDIAEAMVEREGYWRWPRRMWSVKEDAAGGGRRVMHRKLVRICDRNVYGKKGKEGWRWRLLGWKARRHGSEGGEG